ncbi:MAG: C10 family peptidase [Bacteroidales bacterium]|nr:C10 family peptidase [Bacteroidales bacterium]
MRKTFTLFLTMILVVLTVCLQTLSAQTDRHNVQNSPSGRLTHVTSAQALEVGYAFMRTNTHSRGNVNVSKQSMRLVYTGVAKDSVTRAVTDCYYVFSLQPTGFVMVAADERVRPILGYSYSNNFVAEDIPDNVRSWLENYSKQIKTAIDNDSQSCSETRTMWELLRSGQATAIRNITSIAPLLQTTWDQGCYYNQFCPEDSLGSCGHAWAGCVAVAMAQIVRYWEWPNHGLNSHSYTCDYGTLSVNFGATTYNYNNMPNGLSSSTSTSQKEEVAKLIYHCGVAVEMDYAPGGSSAYSSDVPDALYDYFAYADNGTYVSRYNYSDSDWVNLIKHELDSLRPVYYSGHGTGGHAFVCDGYDNSGFFHINWGWNGWYDGYFELSALTPSTSNFSSDQAAIIGIRSSGTFMRCSDSELSFFARVGEESAPQSISVCGHGLSGNISVSAGSGFKVSSDGANYYDILTLPAAGGTMYVKYIPTQSGDVADSLILTSGSYSLTVALNGTDKVIVGSGTATNAYLPSYSYYSYSLTQQIYTPAEIGTPGYIYCIDFYNDGPDQTRNLDIYLVHTDKQTFANGTDWIPVTENDKVFSGVVTLTSGAWTTFQINNFAYDGESNLALVVDDNTGNWSDNYMVCRVFYAQNQALRVYDDYTNYVPANPSGYSGTVLSQKNQLRIGITPAVIVSCGKPSNLVFSNLTTTSVSVSWSNGSGTFGYEYKKSSDTVWTVACQDNCGFNCNLTGLLPNTTYQFRVRSVCAGNTISAWLAGSFTTLADCSTIYTLPFFEGFDSGSLPECWQAIDSDGDGYTWDAAYWNDNLGYAGYGHTGAGCVASASYINNVGALTPNNWLISPPIAIPSQGASLSFWARVHGYPEPVEVLVSTTGNAIANFTGAALLTQTITSDTYTEYTVNLAAYAGQNIYIAFVHRNVTDQYWLMLDDVSVYYSPTNPGIVANPTTLDFDTVVLGQSSAVKTSAVSAYNLINSITATTTAPFEISADGTTFATTATVAQTGGTLYMRYTPTAIGAATGTVTLSSTGASDVFITMTGYGFDTICSIPSDLFVTETGLYRAMLSWTENGTATGWQICLDEDESNLITVASLSYMFTNLSSGMHFFKVRANCGSDGYSGWSNSVSVYISPCESPYNLKTTASVAGTASISWQGNSDGYNLRYRPSGNSGWTLVTGLTSTTYTISGLVAGDYEVEVAAVCDSLNWIPTTFSIMEVLSTANWYGYAGYYSEYYKFVSFSMQNPAAVSYATGTLHSLSENWYALAAAYANGYVWCITQDGDLSRATLDNNNKTISEFETIIPGFENTYSNSMSYNPVDGRIYYNMFDERKLKSFDPLHPEDVTEIGTYNINVLTFAINSAGEAYCVEISTGDLYRLYLNDASSAYIGNTGKNVSYAQSMAFDLQTNELFWAQYYSSDNCGLYKVNPSTAATCLVGQIGGGNGTEFTGLFMGDNTEIACPAPSNLTATLTQGNAPMAMLSWTENGNATSWQVCINGDETNLITVNTTSYTLANLSFGTSYTVKVRARCGTDSYSYWSGIVSFTTDFCIPEDQCEISCVLQDSYGDGWNGGAIKVVDVLTNIVLSTWTMRNGSYAADTLSVCDGRNIRFEWVSGSYDYECSYTVLNANGDTIFSGSGTMSDNVVYAVDCHLVHYDHIYVTENGTGDGSSWTTATGDLQGALNTALNIRNTYGVTPDVWVAAGTYYGDTTSSNAFTMVEGVNVYGGFAGNEPANYDLSQRNFVANETVLDGDSARRVLYQSANFNTETKWDGFTIRNGQTSGSGAGAYLRKNAVLSQCRIQNNTSTNNSGGGVCVVNGRLTDCDVIGNTCSDYGGGVYASGSIISDCRIEGNRTAYSYSYGGGGVYLTSSAVMGCQIVGNTSSHSGGGVYASSNSNIVSCQIINNTAGGYGGGVYSSGSNIMISCRISRNQSSYSGGGINMSSGTQVRNCLVDNNSVVSTSTSYVGGGISGSGTVVNTTIVRNSSPGDGAGVNGTSSTTLRNCIVWGNERNGTADNLNGSSIVCNHCAIEDGYAGEGAVLLDGTSLPLFVSPSLTAGISDSTANIDWHLHNGSVCINRGDNSFVSDSLDLDGTARVKRDTVDVGCFESDFYSVPVTVYDSIIYVTVMGAGTRSGNSWANATSSIGEAQALAITHNAVVWVAAGVYYGDTASGSAFTLRDGVNVYGGFAGNEPASYDLSLRDFETNVTILDGMNARRVLYQPFVFNGRTEWNGFTIRNGRTSGSGAGAYLQRNAVLSQCRIQNNISTNGSGGGVYATNARLTDCDVVGNTCRNSGGGIYATSSSVVTSCIIDGNTTTYSYGSNYGGGGVYVYSSSVTGCQIVGNNSSGYGGGVYAYSGSNIVSCQIVNNTSNGSGGGVYVYSNGYNQTIDHCEISHNQSSYSGGGIYMSYTQVRNCLVDNNSVVSTSTNYGGGGISGSGTVVNTTIVRNTSKGDGAGVNGSSSTTLQNCIVWGNERNGAANNLNGSSIVCNHSAIEGGYLGDGVVLLDGMNSPLFVNPSVTAGASDSTANVDWHLQNGSVCINRGDNSFVTDSLDLDGTARIKHDTVDVGCYESDYYSVPITVYDSIIYVTVTGAGTRSGNSWANATSSIEEAQALAITHNAVVWVAAGIYYGDTISGRAFTMRDGVNVFGGFAGNEPAGLDLTLRDFETNATILDGMNARQVLYQPFEFSRQTEWSGFTIRNGRTSGSGAGAYLLKNAVLSQCRIQNNTSTNGSGGGVYATNARMTDCDVVGNTCRNSGGGIYATSSSVVTSCRIDGNTTTYSYGSNYGGGGVYAYSSSVKDCQVVGNNSSGYGGGVYASGSNNIVSCQIINNIAGGGGGGVYVNSSRNNVISCQISHNQSSYSGGGINMSGSYTQVRNCIVDNNSVVSTSTNYGGGGVSGNGTVVNTTIVRNTAKGDGAGVNGSSSTTLQNCIVWGNERNGTPNNLNGSSIVCNHSAVEDGYTGDDVVLLDGANRPMFVNPSMSAGASDSTANVDWHLQNGSVCVNRGDNSFVSDSLDLDGTARVKRDTVDMGCYESDYFSVPITVYDSIIYVTVTGAGTHSGNSWANATSSIEEAQALAQTYNAVVWVAAGTYYGDTTATNAFTMRDGVNVYGGFAGNEPANFDLSLRDFETNPTILDGQNTRRILYQPFDFSNRTVWDGFSIQHGHTIGDGAGAYIRANSVIRHCVFKNNNAQASGGGLCVSLHVQGASQSWVEQNIFSNNTAGNYGGGVYFTTEYSAQVSSFVTISSCLIANNTAQRNGGGVKRLGSGWCRIYNSTITRNRSGNSGGGANESILTNCIVWGNERNGVMDNVSACNCSYSAIEGGHEGDSIIVLNNINQPLFVNPSLTAGASDSTANVDWHLQQGSVCINRGSNAAVTDILDLDGTARIKRDTVDLGCYESDFYSVPVLYCTTAYGEFAATACDSYTWNDQVYSHSGDYQQTFPLANGCDSIATLHLTVNHAATTNEYLTVCASDLPYLYRDTLLDISTPQSLTISSQLLTQNGCDSTVILFLTVTPSTVGNFAAMTPTNNYPITAYPIRFTWDAVENASNYDLYVWPVGDPQPQQPTASHIHGTSYTLSSLANRGAYQWSMTAYNACDTSVSSTRQFTLNVTPTLTVNTNNPVDMGEVQLNGARSIWFQVNGIALDSVISYQLTGTDSAAFALVPTATWDSLRGGRMQLTFHPTVAQAEYTAQMTFYSDTLVRTFTIKGHLADYLTFTTYVDTNIYAMDSQIPIHGRVTNPLNEPVAGLEVEVYVNVMDYVRTFPAISDANGQFTVMFTPQHSEAGYYTVGSRRAGGNSTTVHDDFNIPGMMLASSDWILWEPTIDQPDTGVIAVRNRSQIPLTNIQVTPVSLPNGCTVQFVPLNLAGMATGNLQFIVSGSEVSTGVNYDEVRLNAVSSEGAAMSFSAWYYCMPQRAALDVTPTSLITTMTRGKSKVVDFKIYNNGTGPTGDIYVSLPNVPWMSVVGSDTLPSLAVHDSAYVSIRLSADSTTALVRYTGNFVINCERGEGVSIPYSITAISDSTGTLLVDVTDEYTWNTNGGHGPHLAGANVTVKGYYSLETVATGVTDANGHFVVSDLPEGYYKLIVRADRHAEYQGALLITAGDTNRQDIFIQFQAITYSWEVVPTEIQDEYTYELNVDFETHVPKPVVTMELDRSLTLPEDCQTAEFNVIATNHGLIAALDFSLIMPQSDYLVFTPLINHIDSFPAQTTYIIPVRYQRKDCAELGYTISTGPGDSINPNNPNTPNDNSGFGSGDPDCYYCNIKCYKKFVEATYRYICRQYYWEIIPSYEITYVGVPLSNCVDSNPHIPRVGGRTICPFVVGGGGGGIDTSNKYEPIELIEICDTNLTPCQNAINGVLGCIAPIKINQYNEFTLDGEGAILDLMAELLEKLGVPGVSTALCVGSIIADIPNIIACIHSLTHNHTPDIRERDLETVLNLYEQFNPIPYYMQHYSVDPLVYDLLLDQLLEKQLPANTGIYRQGQITPTGRAAILDTCQTIDSSITVVYLVNDAVDRWNNTVVAWDSGYYRIIDAPIGYDTNFAQIDTGLVRELYVLNAEAVSQGYINIFERYNESVIALENAAIDYRDNQNSSSVCASVTVQFSQKMTMTREAFQGTLTINNGHESQPMQDIDVNFVIRDEDGVDCTNLFQINFQSYNNMTGSNGSLVLNALNEGSIVVQFIPTKQAAPTMPKQYSFGGSFSFIDPFTGEFMTYNLYPVDIMVNPSPDLYVNYFMQRDILGDDPLTEDRIEPIVPAELGVIIHNRGAGTAKNVLLETAEPKIIDNEKGLAVDFAMYGAAFNGNERQLGLMEIPFGNIEPGRTGVGEWWFTSTLLGHFVSYEAHVIHNNSFGNPDLSLVSSLDIHPLIHTVYAYGNLDDGINDFLVDDVDDIRNYPDSLYFSNGSRTAVATADSISFDHYVTPIDTIVILTLDPSRIGWNYEQTWDPGRGQYKLVSCTRNSDQQVIPLSNVWQSHVTIPVGADPIYENRLHIVDTLSNDLPTTYTLVFSLYDLVLEVDSIRGVPDTIMQTPLTSVIVKFNKSIVDSTFTYSDMSLRCNNGPNLLDENLQIEKLDSVTYRLHLAPYTTQSGYYVLNIQTLDITDTVGFNGYYGKQVTWIQNIQTCLPVSISVAETICQGETYIFHGRPLVTAGSYTDTLQTVHGCDSIVTLHLTVNHGDYVEVTVDTCGAGFYWPLADTIVSQSGTYYHYGSNANACTDTTVLMLSLHQPATTELTAQICAGEVYDQNGFNVSTAGDHYLNFQTVHGCDSVVILHLTVGSEAVTHIVASICESESYNGNGFEITAPAAGVHDYSNTIARPGSCDSIVTLHLTVNHSTTGTVTAVACDSYDWYGTTYTQSGDYTHTLTNANGCDSIVTLHLTVNHTTYGDITAMACDSYDWYGTTYMQSGDYTHTLTNAEACDSVVTLHLTVNHSTYGNVTAVACDSYDWYGSTYTQSGDYTHTLTNAAGCDSIVTLHLTVNHSTTGAITVVACDSYDWYGSTYTQSGDYTHTLTNANGCDSIVTLHLMMNHTTYGNVTAVACDSYDWYGTTYTQSGDYTHTLTNAAGCDSIVTLHLTVNHSTYGNVTAVACNSYDWYGTTYTQSGDYTHTLTNANGCDSIVTLHLTVNHMTYGNITAVACDSYDWYGTTYTHSGNYTHTLTNAAGCDSIVTLHLTVNHGDYVAVTVDTCGTGFYWPLTDTIISQSGTYYHYSTNVNSCTDTTVLMLSLHRPALTELTAQICAGEVYDQNGFNVSTAGDHYLNFQTVHGCDSVVILHLTVGGEVVTHLAASICEGESYNENGFEIIAPAVGVYDYSNTVVRPGSCDSIVTLHLTVNHSTTDAITAVACDSYDWYGATYTQSGDYTHTLTNVAGCDSIVTLHLTVNHSTTGSITAVACDSYDWYGTTYTQSGDYTHTLTNAAGCDSIVTLHLTVNHTTYGNVTAVACDSYDWYGTTYTQSGDYTHTLANAHGCDSIVTLHLTVNHTTYGDITVVACDSYGWSGTTYTQSGDYTHTSTNAHGCDSIVTLHLTVNHSTYGNVTAVVCDSYDWHGTTYTQSGDYTHTLTNAAGCDSIVTLHLTVNHTTYSNITAVACDNYDWYGTTYTQSGDYTHTLTNVAGCDSIVTLHLTVNHTTYGNITAVACNSYDWYGTTYTQSGDYTHTLTNAHGCDSIVTLHLTVNHTTYGDITAVACNSYIWYGTIYMQSGVYTHTLTNVHGCDSVLTLHLTVNYTTYGSITAVACDSYDWYGTTYTQSGDYTHTLTNANGCDSIVTLHLTVNHTTYGAITAVACDSYDWYGTTYTQSGNYTHTLTNAHGCDSIVTLHLTVNHTTYSNITAVACDNYDWYGTTYTQSGDYTHTLTNAHGCDSIVTLHLTVNYTTYGNITAVACDSYDWYGITYTQSGDYTHMLTNAAGCDSILTLHLTVNHTTYGAITAVACDSYDWYGTTYTQSGDYTHMLTNANGCDSILTLHLTVNPTTYGNITAVACDSYDWYGTAYTQSGDYTHTLTNANGCDSIVTLHLTVNPTTYGNITAVACDSYDWYGTTYTQSGDYTHTLTNAAGCDSILTLHLTVNHTTYGAITAVACDSYDWYGTTYTQSGDYTHTLTNAAGCDSIVTLHLTVNYTTYGSITAAACDSYDWYDSIYTQSGDYTHTLTNAAGCDSIVTLHLTVTSTPEMFSIMGDSIICMNQFAPYYYNITDNNYHYQWYKNDLLWAEDVDMVMLHEMTYGPVSLVMRVEDLSSHCTASTTKIVQVQNGYAPDTTVIRRKGNTNILVCQPVTSSYGVVHYQWGYTDRISLNETLMNGDYNYCRFDMGIDTQRYDYWVETYMDVSNSLSCANRSYYGHSLNTSVEDYDDNVVDAYMTHDRMILSVSAVGPNPIVAGLYDVNGRLLFSKDYGITDKVSDNVNVSIANGIYFLRVTIGNQLYSVKLLKIN